DEEKVEQREGKDREGEEGEIRTGFGYNCFRARDNGCNSLPAPLCWSGGPLMYKQSG
ncbi:hypothetical protein KUCAC02_010969, partial [Chaenocephalus aceratus]